MSLQPLTTTNTSCLFDLTSYYFHPCSLLPRHTGPLSRLWTFSYRGNFVLATPSTWRILFLDLPMFASYSSFTVQVFREAFSDHSLRVNFPFPLSNHFPACHSILFSIRFIPIYNCLIYLGTISRTFSPH